MTGGNMPFIAIKDNNSLQKIVSIAFQPRSKMALMGVTVWNRGDSGMRSDILEGGTVG